MNKKIIIIPIVFVITILVVGFSLDSSEEENNDEVFHVTLADPDLYIEMESTPVYLPLKRENILLGLFQTEVVQRFYQ